MQFERKIARKFFFVPMHCVYLKREGWHRVHGNVQTAWLSRSEPGTTNNLAAASPACGPRSPLLVHRFAPIEAL
jgi:hypothetical protein